jgi:hypothetical protein
MRASNACTVVILATAVGVTTAAPVPESTKSPTRVAPSLRCVAAADVERGEIQIEVSVCVMVPVAVERVVEVEGKKVRQTVTEYRTEMRTEVHALGLHTYEVLTADGKRLAKEEVAKRVVRGSVLVFCPDDRLPEPAYLRLFKPDTVFLVPKPTPKPAVDPVPPPPPSKP